MTSILNSIYISDTVISHFWRIIREACGLTHCSAPSNLPRLVILCIHLFSQSDHFSHYHFLLFWNVSSSFNFDHLLNAHGPIPWSKSILSLFYVHYAIFNPMVPIHPCFRVVLSDVGQRGWWCSMSRNMVLMVMVFIHHRLKDKHLSLFVGQWGRPICNALPSITTFTKGRKYFWFYATNPSSQRATNTKTEHEFSHCVVLVFC